MSIFISNPLRNFAKKKLKPLHIINKYNIAGPRYTSYPAVPHWNHFPSSLEWKNHVKEAYQIDAIENGISLYIHLPFCESLCTYCGCNTRITVNHHVEEPYIDALCKEWDMYLTLLPDHPVISEIHLGGGTPTFFSPKNLERLILYIKDRAIIHSQHEFSFEGHPNNTSYEHLATLYDLGFRRVSFGVQDVDPLVQETIHRIQPAENVTRVMGWARSLGYTSVNLDLVYGLPKQTVESITMTFDHVLIWKPDRIAFYSYAHVPWVKPGMRKFNEYDLPNAETKRKLYQTGRDFLDTNGYYEIGMDHFSLPTDNLFTAYKNKALNRNFMGYTTTNAQLLIGLGVSAISDTFSAFAQNQKTVEDYLRIIHSNEWAHFKGHVLNEEEKNTRWHIRQLMCHFQTQWKSGDQIEKMVATNKESIRDMENDGLLILTKNKLEVTEQGKSFVRNICMAIDPLLQESKQPLFSQTV